MLSKTVAVAVLAALAAEPANAFNAHRHLHAARDAAALEDRGVKVHTHWVTEHQVVTVTAGQEPAAASHAPVNNMHVAEPEPAPAPEPVVTEPAQAPQPTTLATKVKAKTESPPEGKDEPLLDLTIPILPSKTKSEPKDEPTSAPGGSPFSAKRGVAYNDASMANIFGSSCKACTWAYNWNSVPDDLDSALSFVPTLWGDLEVHTSHWEDSCQKALDNGSKAIFSFNEPDHAEQSNMSPENAAAAHAKYMNKFKGKALIGAPSVTNSGNPGEGLEWLKSFMTACKAQDGGCAVDFCNVHWYSEAEYADTLLTHLEDAHDICDGKPVWLTEFAPLGSEQAKQEFMKTMIPKLDKLDYLDAYSYFMVSADSLMSSLRALSGVGELYASL